jgi:hypothetical protein
MEHSTDLLRLVAMATKARYFRETICSGDSEEGCSQTVFSKGPKTLYSSSLSSSDASSIISSLQNTLHQADQAAKSARESSKSLEAVATKWRSHRRMLTRESTVRMGDLRRVFHEDLCHWLIYFEFLRRLLPLRK